MNAVKGDIPASRHRHIPVRIRPILALSAALHCAVTSAEVATPHDGPATETDQFVAALETQLAVGEFESAAQQAERWLEFLDGDNYDTALVRPLMLLGDARMGLRDPEGAIEAYDRARHITRIATGIQGVDQLPILYREANAFSALGDLITANERQEFAYDISRRSYGADDPRHMVGIHRLIHWYRHHYKYLAAHVLFEQLLAMGREHLPPDDPLLLRLLREHAHLFRQRVFGKHAVNRGRFAATPPGLRRKPLRQNVSSFRVGRDALGEIIEIQDSNPLASEKERVDALLELADWHLMFGDYPTAVRHYRRVWQMLEFDPERRAGLFGEPTPLFLPLPSDPGRRLRRVRTHRDGVVELALTVTHRGHVIGSKSVQVEPRNLMEYKVRKAARRARYRPAFQDGRPVKVKGHPLTYTYSY